MTSLSASSTSRFRSILFKNFALFALICTSMTSLSASSMSRFRSILFKNFACSHSQNIKAYFVLEESIFLLDPKEAHTGVSTLGNEVGFPRLREAVGLNHSAGGIARYRSQTDHITHMDPDLYQAAMDGKADMLRQKSNQFDAQTTPIKNTVLHIASRFGMLECVEVILNSSPMLLYQVNMKEETALHVAAKRGHSNVVRFLIEKVKSVYQDEETGSGAAKSLMRMVNTKHNTALHEAARYNQLDVVSLLVKEDPEFLHSANTAGETPLFIASERGFFDLADEILKTCTTPSHDGPFGRTALHAAVRCDKKELIAKLLEKKPKLIQEPDHDGWTPMHLAAYLNYTSVVKQLLYHDQSVAYFRNRDGMTAFHIAASVGAISSIKKLVAFCPDCVEVVDNRGRNGLHVAAQSGQVRVVHYILKHPFFSELINEGDDEGNTPLHLLATSKKYIPALINHREVDKWALNDNDLTPLEMVPNLTLKSSCAEADIRRSLKNKMHLPHDIQNLPYTTKDNTNGIGKTNGEDASILQRSRETHLIVATLIATVTFAAGFTLPGGYSSEKDDKGMAVLTKKAAFRAFVASDTTAMILAIAAVFIHFISAMHNEEEINDFLDSATTIIMLAMGAMVVAFVTGLYVVLADSSGFAIAICVLGCSFFFLYFYLLRYEF